jgi:hypothetical protein
LTVNQLVVGSIPTAGANFPLYIRHLGALGRLLFCSRKVIKCYKVIRSQGSAKGDHPPKANLASAKKYGTSSSD